MKRPRSGHFCSILGGPVSGSGWITTCSALAGNSIWNQWLQRRGLSIGPQARLSSRGGFLFRTPVRSDLSFQPAGETWGHASQSAEMQSEMGLVGKPRGQGDFRQWQLSLAEHVLNVFQAPL